MPGRKARTSRVLIFITVILCLISGAVFTQSSAAPSPISGGDVPDMQVVSGQENVFSADAPLSGDAQDADAEPAADSPAPSREPAAASVTPVPTETPQIDKPAEISADASPEAARGVWTADGSSWRFLVDGNAFTGWLTDIDGKRYFFNNDGIMQTGWLTDGEKRYYLNADGIMQTGDITVEEKSYHLLEDGSLEGFTPKPTETPAPKKKVSTKKTSAAKSADKSKKRKTIALTFDDGPGSFTDRLLDCLEANKAKATFFMVGQEIDNFPDTVKRMADMGCELGNHTSGHVDLTTLSAADVSAEIAGTDQKLLALTGQGASVLRPPYGTINDNVTSTVGTPMILWSVDTLDWKTKDTKQTVQTVLDSASDGAIILMHDIYSASVDAAEIIIPKLISQGYELVTVHELARRHGIELKTGIAYGAMQ